MGEGPHHINVGDPGKYYTGVIPRGPPPRGYGQDINGLTYEGREIEFRGIRLGELMWKLCASIMNIRLRYTITLHGALNGFRSGRGTGTATLEASLAQKLAGICHEPPFQVFLDVQKAYNSLDQEQFM